MRHRPDPRDVNDVPAAALATVVSEPSFVERLEDVLLAHGVMPTPGLFSDLDELLDAEGFTSAADALRVFLQRLDGTAAGAALKRLLAQDGEAAREAARRIGVSHVAIVRQQKRISRRLRGVLPPVP